MTALKTLIRPIEKYLMQEPDRRFPGILGVFVRAWVYMLLLSVILFHVLLGAFGGTRSSLYIWTLIFGGYLILLEVVRRRYSYAYNTNSLRATRILLSLYFISWLLHISPQGYKVLWLWYMAPIMAAVASFHKLRWVGTIVLLACFGFFLSTVSFRDAFQFRWGQYASVFVMLSAMSYAVRLIFNRQLFDTSHLEITKMLHETLDHEKLAEQIAEAAMVLTGADRALLIVIDPRDGRYVTHKGPGFKLREGCSIEALAQKCSVLRKNKSFETTDALKEFNGETLYSEFFDCSPRSILAEPILSKNLKVMGVITVSHDEPHRFEHLTQRTFEEFGYQVRSALENSLNFRQARLNEARNLKVSEQLARADNEDDVAGLLVSEALRLIQVADGSVLHRFDQVEHQLKPWRASPVDPNQLGQSIMSPGVGIAGRVLAHGESIVVPDVTEHPWFEKSAQVSQFRSLIVAPLVNSATGETFGTLSVHSIQTGAFSVEDESILVSLCEQGAAILNQMKRLAVERANVNRMEQIISSALFFDINDETKLCQQVVEAACSVLGFGLARLRLLDLQTHELVTVAMHNTLNIPADDIVGTRTPIVDIKPLLTDEFKKGQSYLIPAEHGVWKQIPFEHFYTAPGHAYTHSWHEDTALLAPLRVEQGEILGLLTLDIPLDGIPLPKQLFDAIGVFTTTAAWAIDRMRVNRRTKAFMSSISEELAKCKDLDAVGQVVVQVGTKLLDTEGCSLFFVKGSELELTHSSYLADTPFISRRVPLLNAPNNGLTAKAAATGEILCFNNGAFETDPAWSRNRDHLVHLPSGKVNSVLIVPIKSARGHIMGALSLENKLSGTGEFNEHDINQTIYLADQVAQAIPILERSQALEKWERLGVEDDLHELMNWHHSGVALLLDAIGELLARGELPQVEALFPQVRDHAFATSNELKTIHTAITSGLLESEDLQGALERMTAAWIKRKPQLKHKPKVNINCVKGLVLPASLQSTFLRIASSAFANCLAHSGMSENPSIQVWIDADHKGNEFSLSVTDNGKGNSGLKRGYGISRMYQLVEQLDRADNICATLDIISSESTGTRVSVTACILGMVRDV